MYRVLVCAALLLQCVCAFSVQEDENVDPSTYFVYAKDRNDSISPRIIGGDTVKPHSYPFQAELVIVKGNALYGCGGVLISSTQVLTAAQCLAMNPDQVVVMLGKHNLTANETGSLILGAKSYVVHKNYNSNTFQNDIALISLPQSVNTSYIQPVEPAQGSNKYEGKMATILGWGQTKTAGASDVLRRVNATVMTNTACGSTNANFKKILKSSHVCTAGAGSAAICLGDAGGPLIVDGVLVGIASFMAQGCDTTYPSVFTRVSEFHDWIARGSANAVSGHLGAIALVALCFSYIFN